MGVTKSEHKPDRRDTPVGVKSAGGTPVGAWLKGVEPPAPLANNSGQAADTPVGVKAEGLTADTPVGVKAADHSLRHIRHARRGHDGRGITKEDHRPRAEVFLPLVRIWCEGELLPCHGEGPVRERTMSW